MFGDAVDVSNAPRDLRAQFTAHRANREDRSPEIAKSEGGLN
jgi:hypothetical protein